MLLDLSGAAAAKVGVAEVTLRERRPRGDPPGQPALVQRDPDDDPDTVGAAGGQEPFGGCWWKTLKMTWTVSASLDSARARALSGWKSLTETPNSRIFPSRRSA